MKRLTLFILTILSPAASIVAANLENLTTNMTDLEIIKTDSRIPGLKIALAFKPSQKKSNDYAVLFLHGSSFPSALSFGFRMAGYSWMDNLADNGYDVFALDFLGYGNSDKYPEMYSSIQRGRPLGRATEVCRDVDLTVDLIIKRTGKSKVYLIGHSWGGSVAALYASRYPVKVARVVLYAAITARQDSSAYDIHGNSFEMLTPAKRIAAMRSLTPEGKADQLETEIADVWGDQWLKSDSLAQQLKSDAVRFPSGYVQDVRELMHDQPYYDPRDITVPTLIIRGEWDRYPNNEDAGKLFGSLVNAPSKKYVVIERGTHVLHLEKQRFQLYEEVLHFLRPARQTTAFCKQAIAVIFEVKPAKGHKADYLEIAAKLRPELEKIRGFISIERFQSISDPEKILSLSFWESEQAIQEWRSLEMHRDAQSKGREYIFKDYRLRVSEVIRDYGMSDRREAPADSRGFHNER